MQIFLDFSVVSWLSLYPCEFVAVDGTQKRKHVFSNLFFQYVSDIPHPSLLFFSESLKFCKQIFCSKPSSLLKGFLTDLQFLSIITCLL